MAISNEGNGSRTPLDYALTIVFLCAFVWLRWWSGLWQNRWVGFGLGAVFAVVYLVRSLGRESQDVHTKRYYLLMSVVFLVLGTAFMSFFLGLLGARKSDDGCLSFITLALGVRHANLYRWSRNQTESTS